ncbi:MAG: NAD(P)H-dependent oxidoreductase [Smithellaceae bacterium]|nr:NAD(P)H-dependent oxidoreductase [Smithellaceae bacterium]
MINMHTLVVYSHPNPESFTHALLDAFTEGLHAGGYTYEVVDLYQIGFNPNFGIADFDTFVGGTPLPDVLEQQKKVEKADALAFICPVFWMNMPANMIGWIVRVFSYGFAYQLTEEGWRGFVAGRIGLLKQKKALVMSPTFFSEEDYRASGIQDAMEKIVCEYGFEYPGIAKADYVFFYRAFSVSDTIREKYLKRAYDLGRNFAD